MGFLEEFALPPVEPGDQLRTNGAIGSSCEELKQGEPKGNAHFHLPHPNSFDLLSMGLVKG
jgi:hypothetical protein